jgi:hypothetical protein
LEASFNLHSSNKWFHRNCAAMSPTYGLDRARFRIRLFSLAIRATLIQSVLLNKGEIQLGMGPKEIETRHNGVNTMWQYADVGSSVARVMQGKEWRRIGAFSRRSMNVRRVPHYLSWRN